MTLDDKGKQKISYGKKPSGGEGLSFLSSVLSVASRATALMIETIKF